ncbi:MULTISPECIES: tripartite tricarboxylate transporter permease [unclassified Halomonas]|uniref:tripartite tricarboxylate transporter permease n=1 Tax=unclassified Halomonas TaxID=2609666 RepID=UPI0005F9E167|nr:MULTISPECIES: tripartite tricarboxylate transporter permease [unclassified Halomonas]MBR9769873.1 tripartite tricarboxylate transporter permease [Gammaproteobacteria bacterium]KJZ08030.1 tricarboxylate transporter [Halomonas sp. S2151]MAR71730.1 tricarboxylate transporter [Halomonas sp.]MBR9880617.1 tripartite tricarboxylate transporter permease [Gammaproteobacteria bacterium]MBY5941479.1 tripartite tricarboxylate transporter permease [Halomonas sp. DP5N14-9]|tara:strand:- start:529 stop:2487 length:1959 start_codon:yes stop_codon:yes gene_type:complete
MLDILLSSLGQLFTLSHLLFMTLGVLVGLVVGIIPGLGGIAGMSLLLPFLYGMEPTVALGMLMGLVAVIPTGDTFASVLLGIPGSSASQATVIDGFSLAKKGQAARALSSAFLSSMIGGLIGAVVLTGFILIARPLVLSFSSSELFMLTLLGLSMVAVLSGADLFKGLAACGLGLLVGGIGMAPATGEFRLNLDIDYLFDGLPLVVVGLGIFALPEIIDLLVKRGAIAEKPCRLGEGWRRGIQDVGQQRGLVARCAAIGSLVGTIPGLAGSVVDWLTYGHAVQSAKDSSEFGKGDIRGVIAPESANNACACGAMVPTLLFGVPGSGTAAVFLGGLLLLGLQPGVGMIETHLDLTYTIIWSLALANILGAALCLILARPVANLTRVPFATLAPLITVLIMFAAFQATRATGDLLALGAIGVLGVLFKQANWSRPAFLIGFVLAPGAEAYFYQAVQFQGTDAFLRPGVLIIGAMILAAMFIPVIGKQIKKRRQPMSVGAAATEPKPDAESHRLGIIDIVLLGALLALAASAWVNVSELSLIGGIMPRLAIAIMALACLAEIVRSVVRRPRWERQTFAREAIWLVGFFALVAAMLTLGFITTATLFTLVFLLAIAKLKPWVAVLMALGVLAFLLAMAEFLTLTYPQGILDPLLFY